jgi:hypothetical protein
MAQLYGAALQQQWGLQQLRALTASTNANGTTAITTWAAAAAR